MWRVSGEWLIISGRWWLWVGSWVVSDELWVGRWVKMMGER